MSDHGCRHIGDNKPRLLRTHQRDCNTSGCPGCDTCPERHCQRCNKNHVTVDGRGSDLTCATCVGSTRDDLAWIRAAAVRLLGEAIVRGINSEAAMLVAPAANPETWGYRRMSALAGRIDATWLNECRDELNPAWVLGTWAYLVRDHLNQPSKPDHRPTLTEAKNYLEGHLTRLAHDNGFPFDELTGDIHRCRLHLQTVLNENDRPDTGVRCPVCGHADLIKDYGADDGDDMWTCTKCDNWWTEADYRTKICGVYVGLADRLTASQMHDQYRINEHTLRTWAKRDKVRTRGRDAQGRMLYDVADAIARRDDKQPARKTMRYGEPDGAGEVSPAPPAASGY